MAGDHFLRIARMTIALRCGDARMTWAPEGAVARFAVPPTTQPDVDLTIRAVDSLVSTTGELIFDSGAVWRLFHDEDGYRIECRSDFFGDAPYKAARLDASFTRGEVLLTPPVLHLNPLDYPLDEVLIATLLGRGRGVELHSCGVIDQDGRGHLFAGVSGAGKTTTARMWEPSAARIISDDRVIVREQDGAMWMYGTPWHGEAELSFPDGAPLAGVYLLAQSASTELQALTPAAAVARLFSCAFPPFHDAAGLDFTLGFLERLASQVPVRELRFTREANVVERVRAEAW